MADRRMFSKTIIDSDAFLDMPLSSQTLYFHLNMAANDKGEVYCPKAIARYIGADESDYQELLNRRYISLIINDACIVITDWRENNGIGGNAKKRLNYSYRQWRKRVLERDGYKCTKCGSTEKLHAHHIKSFADYPEEREVLENGITLCEKCHRKVHWLEKRA